MADVVGPRDPIIIFFCGTSVIMKRSRIYKKGGKRMIGLKMSIPKVVQRQHNISNKEIDYTEYSEGVIEREYPVSCFHRLNENPEDPRILMFCGFDGTKISPKSKEIQWIRSMVDRIDALESENDRVYADNERLKELLLLAVERPAKFKKNVKYLMEDENFKEILKFLLAKDRSDVSE